jgi:hypothetical protein
MSPKLAIRKDSAMLLIESESAAYLLSILAFFGPVKKIVQKCVGLGHSKHALTLTAMKELIALLLAIQGPIFCVSELRKAERHGFINNLTRIRISGCLL